MIVHIAVVSCVLIAVAFVAYVAGYDRGHNDGWYDCYRRLINKARERHADGTAERIRDAAHKVRKRRAF